MPDKRELDVNDPRRKRYTRVISTQAITFICQECGNEVTEEQYPGAAPKWCYACRDKVRRRRIRDRVRRYRERQHQTRENGA